MQKMAVNLGNVFIHLLTSSFTECGEGDIGFSADPGGDGCDLLIAEFCHSDLLSVYKCDFA